jgi:hypothetical protein
MARIGRSAVKLRSIRDIKAGDVVFVVAESATSKDIEDLTEVYKDLSPDLPDSHTVFVNFPVDVTIMSRDDVVTLMDALRAALDGPPSKPRKLMSRMTLVRR